MFPEAKRSGETMKELFEFLAGASVGTIVLVAIAYFGKIFLEKRLESLATSIQDIRKISLDVKRDLRLEERKELVEFRVAVEQWENFLQTVLIDYTMKPPSKADVTLLYDDDKRFFLNVKIAVVKVGIYLRNKELEQELMSIVTKIRLMYYPLINDALSRLIDFQTNLIPFEIKQKQFLESGMTNMAFGPTQQDREANLKLQERMTAEIAAFSEKLKADYPAIAQLLVNLKESMNQYIYRRIGKAEIDSD
jgi:hypothetical protein